VICFENVGVIFKCLALKKKGIFHNDDLKLYSTVWGALWNVAKDLIG
jgi:hypothetical protein